MAKSTIKTAARVHDTVRPTVAGAKERPGWHLLRTVAGRITTPLLPDDYLKLANPLWSARELRGRVLARKTKSTVPAIQNCPFELHASSGQA